MSTQQGTVSAPASRPTRPVTLAAAISLSLGTGALALISAIVMLAAGKDSIRTYVQSTVQDIVGTDVSQDLINSTVGAELDAAYHTLVTKAVVGIVASLLILVFAFLARQGSRGMRIGLAISLVVGIIGSSILQLGDHEVLPGLTVLLATVTLVLSIVAIVLLFLPATNRYSAAVKDV